MSRLRARAGPRRLSRVRYHTGAQSRRSVMADAGVSLPASMKTIQKTAMKNKYNLAARASLVALVLTAAFTLNASAATLWYNGDFDGINGLANEKNTIVSQAAVYDDFNVTGPGWNVNAVFSDNL